MFPSMSPPEMLVILGIAVLLFGKRLPEVGRSLGKGIIEFKKGLRGLDDDGEDFSAPAAPRRSEPVRPAEALETAVPKFEPPASAPYPATDAPAPTYPD